MPACWRRGRWRTATAPLMRPTAGCRMQPAARPISRSTIARVAHRHHRGQRLPDRRSAWLAAARQLAGRQPVARQAHDRRQRWLTAERRLAVLSDPALVHPAGRHSAGPRSLAAEPLAPSVVSRLPVRQTSLRAQQRVPAPRTPETARPLTIQRLKQPYRQPRWASRSRRQTALAAAPWGPPALRLMGSPAPSAGAARPWSHRWNRRQLSARWQCPAARRVLLAVRRRARAGSPIPAPVPVPSQGPVPTASPTTVSHPAQRWEMPKGPRPEMAPEAAPEIALVRAGPPQRQRRQPPSRAGRCLAGPLVADRWAAERWAARRPVVAGSPPVSEHRAGRRLRGWRSRPATAL